MGRWWGDEGRVPCGVFGKGSRLFPFHLRRGVAVGSELPLAASYPAGRWPPACRPSSLFQNRRASLWPGRVSDGAAAPLMLARILPLLVYAIPAPPSRGLAAVGRIAVALAPKVGGRLCGLCVNKAGDVVKAEPPLDTIRKCRYEWLPCESGRVRFGAMAGGRRGNGPVAGTARGGGRCCTHPFPLPVAPPSHRIPWPGHVFLPPVRQVLGRRHPPHVAHRRPPPTDPWATDRDDTLIKKSPTEGAHWPRSATGPSKERALRICVKYGCPTPVNPPPPQRNRIAPSAATAGRASSNRGGARWGLPPHRGWRALVRERVAFSSGRQAPAEWQPRLLLCAGSTEKSHGGRTGLRERADAASAPLSKKRAERPARAPPPRMRPRILGLTLAFPRRISVARGRPGDGSVREARRASRFRHVSRAPRSSCVRTTDPLLPIYGDRTAPFFICAFAATTAADVRPHDPPTFSPATGRREGGAPLVRATAPRRRTLVLYRQALQFFFVRAPTKRENCEGNTCVAHRPGAHQKNAKRTAAGRGSRCEKARHGERKRGKGWGSLLVATVSAGIAASASCMIAGSSDGPAPRTPSRRSPGAPRGAVRPLPRALAGVPLPGGLCARAESDANRDAESRG